MCLNPFWGSNVVSNETIGLENPTVEARRAGKIAFFNRTEPDKLFIDGVLNPL